MVEDINVNTVIDFKRNKDGITAKLIQSNMIQTVQLTLLLVYADGEKRYIIAPKGLQVGLLRVVQMLTLKLVTHYHYKTFQLVLIHNIELKPGKGGQLVQRCKFTSIGKEGKYNQITFW